MDTVTQSVISALIKFTEIDISKLNSRLEKLKENYDTDENLKSLKKHILLIKEETDMLMNHLVEIEMFIEEGI